MSARTQRRTLKLSSPLPGIRRLIRLNSAHARGLAVAFVRRGQVTEIAGGPRFGSFDREALAAPATPCATP